MHRTYEPTPMPMMKAEGNPNRVLVKSRSNKNRRVYWEPYKDKMILWTLEQRDREDLPWTETHWIG